MSHLRTRRSYREVWFGPGNVPKEILLNVTKFYLNTSSGSGVITKLRLREGERGVNTSFLNAQKVNVWSSILI